MEVDKTIYRLVWITSRHFLLSLIITSASISPAAPNFNILWETMVMNECSTVTNDALGLVRSIFISVCHVSVSVCLTIDQDLRQTRPHECVLECLNVHTVKSRYTATLAYRQLYPENESSP